MDREIQHILSENYPNPPPPGFRYPPLPRIIQLNENEIKTEYCSDEHLAFETVTNMESEEDIFHDSLSISIDESMEVSIVVEEYVKTTTVSIDESMKVSPVVEEYVKTTTVSNKVLENIIEERVEHDYQKAVSNKILEDIIEERVEHDVQKAVSNKILKDMVEERVEHDLQKAKQTEPIEAETKNVKEILNISKIDNPLLIVNEINLNQVDQMSKHQFFEYPHSPPFGLYHMFIPKIASCYSKEELNIDKKNHNRSEQNCDEKEKIASQLELINSEKLDISEENLKKLQTENKNHSIIEKNVINSQPKTTDKDQQVNKLYKKTDGVVGNERVEQRIKTTICCCIKI